MQILQLYLLIIAALSLHANNVICMEAVRMAEPLECFKKPDNMRTEVPSLKKLCINTIATSIQKDNINTLAKEEAMQNISSLPENLNKKITAKLFCYKPGYQHFYEKIGSCYNNNVMFDEINNQVMFTNKSKATLTLLTINGETINSFPWSNKGYSTHCQNGSLIVQQNDHYKNSITIIKDGKMQPMNGSCSPQYCSLEKILKNQHELIFWDYKKYSLYNFYQCSKAIYDKVDSIQFDNSETICMVRNSNKVIISTPKRNDDTITCVTLNGPNAGERSEYKRYRNEYETKITFNEIENAYLNPNGKQLLIKPKDQPVKLIKIKKTEKEETVFTFEKSKGTMSINAAHFSPDGNYLLFSQYAAEGEGLFYLLDTQKGKICVSLRLPNVVKPSFNKKYLTLKDADQICLIPIKNLATIDKLMDAPHVFTIEDIIKLGVGKPFNNFEYFHPNGKHIILRPNYQWQLIDPKSEKPILIVDYIIRSSLSNPMGKMLFLENSWYTGYEVLSLRNDFTIEEFLLNRFMVENNINEADLSKYPHMQEIYNKMDKDKRLFHCLENGRRKTDSLLQNAGNFIQNTAYSIQKNNCIIS